MKSRKQTAHTNASLRKLVRTRPTLIVLIAIAACCTIGTAYGQTLIGSPGSGWQTWTVVPNSPDPQPNLNDNGAPWWDLQWNAASSSGAYATGPADKNPGFCMTATGDCVGIGSGALAPGTLPFWGQSYDSVNDANGLRDDKVYFRSSGSRLRATLYLNATANPDEVNEFGWFETNSTGTVKGALHLLFNGTGSDHNQVPTPTGTSVVFTPTRYFGFYYSDVSEHACPDGTAQFSNPAWTEPCGDATLPLHGCYALSIFSFNDARCTEVGGNQGDHDFVIFKDGTPTRPNYWIAGEDPADCASNDGDCNLTLVKVVPVFN
jgi:hypothetical protein